MAGTIHVRCKGSKLADLSKLKIIQGDLKELSEASYKKLRKLIETKGFTAPIFTWKNNILDGTQRFRVLQKMIEEGWELPKNQVPVCEINAKDLNDAKEILLSFVSQFGKISDDGLYEFIQGMPDLDFDLLDLPDFNMEAFKVGFLGDDQLLPDNNEDIDEEAMKETQNECPKCGFKW